METTSEKFAKLVNIMLNERMAVEAKLNSTNRYLSEIKGVENEIMNCKSEKQIKEYRHQIRKMELEIAFGL